MTRKGRLFALMLSLAAMMTLAALPAFAADEGEEEESVEPAPISEETEEGSSGLEPAVEIPEQAEAEVVPDWTYRYLVPTGIALAVVVVLVTSIQYFTNVVRKRYRIVEE